MLRISSGGIAKPFDRTGMRSRTATTARRHCFWQRDITIRYYIGRVERELIEWVLVGSMETFCFLGGDMMGLYILFSAIEVMVAFKIVFHTRWRLPWTSGSFSRPGSSPNIFDAIFGNRLRL